MADDDDLISKILNEDSSTKLDYNSNNYDVNAVLNSLEDNTIINSVLNENNTENKENKQIEEKKEEIENKEILRDKEVIDKKEEKKEDVKIDNKDLNINENKEIKEEKDDEDNKENIDDDKLNKEEKENDIKKTIENEKIEDKKENNEIKINVEENEDKNITENNKNITDTNIKENKESIENKQIKEKEQNIENNKTKDIKIIESKIEIKEPEKQVEIPKKIPEKIEPKLTPKSEEKIIKEPKITKKEENLNYFDYDPNNLDDEINKILNEQIGDIPSISTSDIQKEIEEELKDKAKKELENEIKKETKLFNLNNDKDEDYEKDIEKMIEEGKNQKLKEEQLKKKKEEEQKMLKSFYPPFKNPLDFVQYLEVDKIMGQINNEMKNFAIQNHRKQDNKYDVSQIRSLSMINKNLSKFNINFISAKNNNLIVTTLEGNFLFYSIQTQKIIKSITPKNLKSNKITCLDINDDYSDMVVGYQDGVIVLINISSGEVKYTNNKLHKDSSIIELKIYKKEKNDLFFISSSSNGDVYFNTLKMLGFASIFWRLNSVKININNTSPIFLVKFIQFSKENQRLYSNLKQLKRYVILGSLESISVYCVEPLQEIFEIKKPSFIKETVVPDAQIGIGRPPDVFMRFVKKDEKNHLLLIISWGKIIYFYQMPIINGDSIEHYKELGYYINLFNILRIGFMNNSVVYCLDKSFAIKVLDSSKINPGKIKIVKGQPEIPKKNYLAEIEQSRLVSASISSQNKIYGYDNKFLDTYLYSIVETEDNINSVVVLGERNIYLVNLVDWQFFLEYLQNKKDFINLFSVGIEIFKGKMMCFSNIPEEKLKKKKVGDKLRQLVNQYVTLNIQDKKTNEFLLEESSNQEKIGNCIKTAIEFCIEIESFDYLIKSIQPPLESKDYGELFLTKLQPFILCDKIKNITLSSDIILNLIDLYNKKDKLDILSQMLLHININSIDTSEIRQKLEEMNLITPLIYLYMNGQNENYFTPLEKMFDYFYSKAISNKSLMNKENNTIDYSYALTQELVTEKDLRECKEYNGHKILWYIRWCLTGKKFPDSDKKMDKILFENLVPKITYWLLIPKVIDEFLRFDPKNYFMIYKNIFSIEDLRKKIINAAKDFKYSVEIKGMLSSSDVKIDNIEPGSLIKYMVDWSKKKNDIKIYFYLYDFIIYILSTNIEIEKEFKKEAICFTLKNYKSIVKDKNNQEIILMINNLINIIEKEKNFEENDYKIILESVIDKDFNELKLFLFDKLDNFKACLELFLSKELNINDRDTKVFNWIKEKIKMFKEKGDKYKILIKTIEDHTMDLALLSINNFFELTREVFSQSYKSVVERLKEDKKTQLAYIELFIKNIINSYDSNDEAKDIMTDIKYILDRHISLLCDLDQHDKIIPAFEACSFYPLDLCLTYCENAKAYEPCLYLYLKEGSFDKAFKLASEKLDEVFTNIINTIDKEKDFDNLLNEFYKYLNDVKNICENNNMQLEDLWFKILNIFYQYEGKVGELLKVHIFNIKKKNSSERLSKIISKEIKELMEKMCSFVSVTQILNFVSEHNKNAGFKEFRELITKILSSYSNLTSILYSTRSLMTNAILEDEHYFQTLNLKGELLNANKCDLCKQEFKEEQGKKEMLMVFNCNHIFHKECVIKKKARFDKHLMCPLCSEIDFDTGNNKGKSLINKNSFIIEEEKNESNKFLVKVGASARKTLQKLEKYDDRSLEKHVLMINNSITVLKDKYRKEYK